MNDFSAYNREPEYRTDMLLPQTPSTRTPSQQADVNPTRSEETERFIPRIPLEDAEDTEAQNDIIEPSERFFPGGPGPVIIPPVTGGPGPVIPGQTLPDCPGGGPGPVIPDRPNFPGVILPLPPTGTAQVRFLHAATGALPYSVSVGTRTVAPGLRYAEATDYARVADGFRTVTIMSARSPRSILLRKSIPFRANGRTTLVIVNARNGIDLLEVQDNGCVNMPRNAACFRMVNTSYTDMPLDLLLYDGRIVFSDVRFREATTFRRVRPGEYGFYLAATNASPYFPFAPDVDIETVEDLPIPVGDNYIPDYGDLMPLASFYEAFRQGILYTAYVLGLGTPDYPYFVTTLETR